MAFSAGRRCISSSLPPSPLLLLTICRCWRLYNDFLQQRWNDLIMVPIVLEVTALLKLTSKGRIAYLLGVGLMADTASAPLMMSNLTNILTADFFQFLLIYMRENADAGIVATLATTIAVSLAFFGRMIKNEESRGSHARRYFRGGLRHLGNRLFRLSWVIIVMMMVRLFDVGALRHSRCLIALGCAAIQWAASSLFIDK